MSTVPGTFRFGDFELDVASYELRREGRPVRLERQPMDLLILLVERRRPLLSRGDIITPPWPQDGLVDVQTGGETPHPKIPPALGDFPEAPPSLRQVPATGNP